MSMLHDTLASQELESTADAHTSMGDS